MLATITQERRQAEILVAIHNAWLLTPELRLGQLLVNMTSHLGDVFYASDEDLIVEAEAWREKYLRGVDAERGSEET